MRRIGFLVLPGCSLLDFAGPLTAFDMANQFAAQLAYRIDVLSEGGAQMQNAPGLVVQTQGLGDPASDTLVISGGNGSHGDAFSPRLIASMWEATVHLRYMTSVCPSAFVLAAVGLPDGRRATTHWRMAVLLQRRYPCVQVQSDHIFIHDSPMWMSVDISSGIDLALALIEEDLGVDVSYAVTRGLVIYYRRSGGQSQFSTLLELDPALSRIVRALSYAHERLHEALNVDRLAEAAHLSRRQFDRAFVAETGQTPARAIEKLHTEIARPRVETGDESLEHIARTVDFADPERMRRVFIRVFGQPPQSARRSGRSGHTRLAA